MCVLFVSDSVSVNECVYECECECVKEWGGGEFRCDKSLNDKKSVSVKFFIGATIAKPGNKM